MKHIVLALVACAALLAGCTTLQQDINIEQHSYSEEVLSFEAVLAQLDADALVSGAADSVAAAQFVQDIDGAIADPAVQKASLARLYALRGRGYLLLGKTGKARDSYEESVKAYKGDSQSLVLGARLGILSLGADSASSGAAAERALIVLEEAVTLYRGRQFTGAVAKFDEAFLSLELFYRESYAKVRDAAWGFRSLSDAENQGDVMFRNEITVAEMVAIARENSDLLYNYTAGKQLGQHDLFVKISRSGLLDAASGAPSAENALGEGDRATRFASARFLWNLYNARKNSGALATKYSARYRAAGRASPVPDVPVDHPDFDAVLGCVEREFMNLDDGKNFAGGKTVSAVEFDEYLQKVK